MTLLIARTLRPLACPMSQLSAAACTLRQQVMCYAADKDYTKETLDMAYKSATGGLDDTTSSMTDAAKGIYDSVKDTAQSAKETVKDATGRQDDPSAGGKAVGNVVDVVTDAAKQAYEKTKRAYKAAEHTVKDTLDEAVGDAGQIGGHDVAGGRRGLGGGKDSVDSIMEGVRDDVEGAYKDVHGTKYRQEMDKTNEDINPIKGQARAKNDPAENSGP
eukprot:jgi/Chrzof1/14111/Cz08g25150.t1